MIRQALYRALLCLSLVSGATAPAQSASWCRVDQEDLIVDNGVIRYEYIYTGVTNYGYCSYYGTGISDFVDLRNGRDHVIGLDGLGTGYALVDGSEPHFTKVQVFDNYAEISFQAGERLKTDRIFKGLPVLEMEYLNVGGDWIDDGFSVEGDMTLVCHGLPDANSLEEGRALRAESEKEMGHNFFGSYVRANWSSLDRVLYKNHVIYGVIDRSTGAGIGMVWPHAYSRIYDHGRNRKYAAVKFWWDSETCINTEMFPRAETKGLKRWAFAVTEGRDEIMRIGKTLVDHGTARGLTMDDFTSASVTETWTPVSEDNEPPSVPEGLRADDKNTWMIMLRWDASNDNSTAPHYEVIRGDESLARTAGYLYQDNGLDGATTYTYRVRAFDKAGNYSDWSKPFEVMTPSRPEPDTEIKNPSFREFDDEGRYVGWNGPAGPGRGRLSRVAGHTDSFSLNPEGRDDYAYLEQPFTLAPGKTYRFTMWVKGEEVEGFGQYGKGVGMRYVQLLPDTRVTEAEHFLTGTFDWQPFTLEVTAGENHIDGRLDLYWNFQRGQAWIDDVTVEILD